MRALCFLFLLAFAGAVGVFAYQNQQDISLTFLQWQIETSVAVVAGVVYGLGMFTGWTVIGMLRRSFERVAEDRSQHYAYR